MSEINNVVIKGLDSKLPKWATEGTLRELEDEVKKLVVVMSRKKDIISLKTKESQENLGNFNDSLKELMEEQKGQQFSIRKFIKNVNSHAEEATDAIEKIKVAGHSGYTSMSALTNVGQGLTSIFKTMSTPAGFASVAMLGLVEGFESLAKYLSETVGVLLKVYDTGLTFQNSLGELRFAASDAAMPLNDFGQMLIKNSALIKSFGANGVKGFANVLKQTQNLAKSQGYYGLTLSQINEYAADYMETLRLQGVLTKMSDDDRANAGNEYIKQLTAYSQVLGKSRGQIDKETKNILNSSLVIAGKAQLSKTQSKNFDKTIMQIVGGMGSVGEVFGDQFSKSAFTFQGQVDEMSQAMYLAGNDVGDSFNTLARTLGDKNNTLTSDQTTEMTLSFLKNLKNMSKESLNTLDMQSKVGNEQARLILAAYNQLQDADLDKLIAENAKGPGIVERAWVNIQNAYSRIQASFQNIFAQFIENNSGILTSIATNMDNFAQYLAIQLQGVLTWISEIVNPATREKAIGDIMTGVQSLIETIIVDVGKALVSAVYSFPKWAFATTGEGLINSTRAGVNLITSGRTTGDIDLGSSSSSENVSPTGAVEGSKVWQEQKNIADLTRFKGGNEILLSPTIRSNSQALQDLKQNAETVATIQPELSGNIEMLKQLVDAQLEANKLAQQQIDIANDQKRALDTGNSTAKYNSNLFR